MHESLSQADFSDLESFLADARRPDGTLRFQELQGFLFAVASSPELIPPSAWQPIISEELDGEFGSSAMVLSFFSSRTLAEAYYLESTTTPRHRRPQVPFSEYAETVRELFPAALSSYAHIGRTISEVIANSGQSGP